MMQYLTIEYFTISLIVLPILSIIYTVLSIQHEKKIINNVLNGFAALELFICTGLLVRGGGAMFYNFEFDFTALLYIWLTIFVIHLCTVFLPSERYNTDMAYFLILIVKVPLILFFSTTHLVTFYICFESVLLPLFYLIASYGSRPQRIPAAYKLFFYTVLFFFNVLFLYIFI